MKWKLFLTKTQVRIATHPDYQGMKYGKHAIGMLIKYFKGELVSIDEDSDEEEVEDVVKNEIPNTNVWVLFIFNVCSLLLKSSAYLLTFNSILKIKLANEIHH